MNIIFLDIPEEDAPLTMTAAEFEYWQLYEQITEALEQAQQLVDAHAEAATAGGNPPDWTHVGDLVLVHELVNQLTTFVSSQARGRLRERWSNRSGAHTSPWAALNPDPSPHNE